AAMSSLENFDLEEHIAEWRHALLASTSIGTEEADELEDHLRQEIERLSTGGISTEKSFVMASRKVGTIDALAAEYGKVSSPFFAFFCRRLGSSSGLRQIIGRRAKPGALFVAPCAG